MGESREEGEVISNVGKEGRRGLGVATSMPTLARNGVGVWEVKNCREREREREYVFGGRCRHLAEILIG